MNCGAATWRRSSTRRFRWRPATSATSQPKAARRRSCAATTNAATWSFRSPISSPAPAACTPCCCRTSRIGAKPSGARRNTSCRCSTWRRTTRSPVCRIAPILNEELPRLIDEAARRGDSLSILYIDCDNFKNINDSRGHSIGDDYLRSGRAPAARFDREPRPRGAHGRRRVPRGHAPLRPRARQRRHRRTRGRRAQETRAARRGHLLRHHQHRPLGLSARCHHA